ncbi:MAG: tetratricopeptide repeat protein [Acidobacteriota bacterium]
MRRKTVLLLAMLLAAAGAFAQDLLSQARDAFRNGDFRSAARLFSQAADQESDSGKRADIRVQLAVTYVNMNNRAKAEEAFTQALRDNPHLDLVPDFYAPEVLSIFSRVKARQGEAPPKPAGAGSPAGRQAAPAGDLPGLRQRLAQAMDNTDVEAILGEIQQLELNTPASGLPEVLELKAAALDRLGRPGAAIEQRGRAAALRAAAQAPPGTSVVPLEALLEGRRLLAAGQPADAEAMMRGVLAALPSCAPALEVMGEALLDEGKLDEAFSAVRTAMLGNDTPELWRLLGEVELRRGRLASARDAFRRSVDGDPGSDRGWAALGLIAARMEDYKSAREGLDKALELNGTLFQARVVRAEIALADHQPAVALQQLQRALQIRPDDTWATGWLGVAYLESGNVEAAAGRLRTGAQATGGEIFLLPLAEALRRQGKVDEALQTVAADKSAGSEHAVLMARCLIDARQPAQAVPLLNEALSQRPDDGRARYLLGVALHASGQWDQAAATLAAAVGQSGAPDFAADSAKAAEATRKAEALMNSAVAPPPPPAKR